MDGLATQVARRAIRTSLAARHLNSRIGVHDGQQMATAHIAKGTGPPALGGPFECITSGVRGPP